MKEEIMLDEDLIYLDGIDHYKKSSWDKYTNNEFGNVPRVTHIISRCSNNDALVSWAASMGYRRYKAIQNTALEIGTIVHEYIDDYLDQAVNHGITEVQINDIDLLKSEYQKSVKNSISNFDYWFTKLKDMRFPVTKILGIEVEVNCPWFGGTIDAIIEINNAIYIVDFKTSKSIHNSYLIQAAAYMWVINNGYGPSNIPHIDGIGIIRVDKNKYPVLDDLFLNEFDPAQRNIIYNLQRCFMSYVETYYRACSVDYQSNAYNKSYNQEFVFSKGE